MGQLDTLGPRRRARRVVDRAGGVLVDLDARRPGAVCRGREQLSVGDAVEHDALGHRHARQHVGELRVDEKQPGSRVLQDVGDLFCVEPEVDRDEDPAVPAHPEESRKESPGIRAHDGHALTRADPHGLEGDRHAPGPCVELRVGDAAERSGNPWLVHHRKALGVDERGPVQEVSDGQRHAHGAPGS